MNADTLAAALATGDVSTIVATVRAWTADYRARGGDPFAFADAVSPLANHAEARVRQAVAEAGDLFSESLFEHLAGILGKDSDPYVSGAMKRSAKRLASRATKHARSDEQGLALARVFDEAQKKHGAAGRKIAERAARRSAEYFVRRLHHETSKVILTLEMTIVRATAEAKKRDVDRAELSLTLETASERLGHLKKIVDRAREATQTETAPMHEESLASIVSEAHKDVVARLGARASALDVTIDIDPSLTIRADRTSLLQAFENLLANGAQAYPASAPRITLSVTATSRRLGSEVEIVFADAGEGMNDEQRATMFMPFGSLKPGGTGIGLVIVRNVVEQLHGGTMRIDSTVGIGTKVSIVLPTKGKAS